MEKIIKGYKKPKDNTQKFRFNRSGKERGLSDSYTLLYWDGKQIQEALVVRTYWGTTYRVMYAACWIRGRTAFYFPDSAKKLFKGVNAAGGCKVDWNYETRSVHGAICAAGIILDEQAAGLHPRDILYGIAKDLGLAAPYVVHAHK